ncbi:MAG: hypothetical protein R3C14_37925 [Caldilineaceae bacterium]
MRSATTRAANTTSGTTAYVSVIDTVILLYCGLSLMLPALTLLVTPGWFYNALADFPPFNRHFMGDAGAFSLALGIGILLAIRNPAAHRNVIGITALGNTVHVFNHLYDDLIIDGGNIDHLMTNTVPLILLSLLLVIVWWRARGK